jgi:hypothetical protein
MGLPEHIISMSQNSINPLKKYSRIGVAQIYPWRPHAAQRDFLLRLARNAGYQTSELVCNGSLTRCYDKLYQTIGWGGVDHCLKCRLGGAKERAETQQFALDWSKRDQPVDGEREAMLSNIAAIIRAEVHSDLATTKEQLGILQAYRVGYHSALRWIEELGVDLILLFNGRIDILRGVMDAARAAGVDFASYERSWFGRGIMLIPNENCLGLQHMHEIGRRSLTTDLSTNEIANAKSIIRQRVERSGSHEWRDFQVQGESYDSNAGSVDNGAVEILVLPSSTYEIWGHPDWQIGWRDNFEAIDWLQQKLGVPWVRWLVRGHPIWAQRVGRNLGDLAEKHYRDFCASRGIRYIPSNSPVRTPELIDLAELVVVNGGSSVIEAIWRGKPAISLSESAYRNWEFCPTALSPESELAIPDDATRRRKLVSFIHGMDRLVPTFVDHMVPISSAEQVHYDGANFQDIVDQVQMNTLIPPNKNSASVGSQIIWSPSLAERARKIIRMGDS